MRTIFMKITCVSHLDCYHYTLTRFGSRKILTTSHNAPDINLADDCQKPGLLHINDVVMFFTVKHENFKVIERFQTLLYNAGATLVFKTCHFFKIFFFLTTH